MDPVLAASAADVDEIVRPASCGSGSRRDRDGLPGDGATGASRTRRIWSFHDLDRLAP
jgi:hypothetical protein